MVRWEDLEREAPALASFVADRFRAQKHHTMATVRRDGGPRISGTEVVIADGDLWLGSMGGARKAQDLRRDPRIAIHAASVDAPDDDPAAWVGDAKLAGRAVEVTDPATRDRFRSASGAAVGDDDHLFRVELTEVVRTGLSEDGQQLEVVLWTPAGQRTFRR